MSPMAAVNICPPEDDGASGVGAPVLDLVHLSRQTFGDHALETELLTLFDRQAAHFAERLRAPWGGADDARARVELAHMLKGSASAVGAFGVARAAQACEAALRAAGPGETACDALIGEIGRARAAIAELLSD
jgi:HPt (histidine-containing phosphotransfer) domain-containing protein